LIRLSVHKGQGRVRVYGFDLGTVSEPLTSILSPCSKGGEASEKAAILSELMQKSEL
jgi:hypothetical protein